MKIFKHSTITTTIINDGKWSGRVNNFYQLRKTDLPRLLAVVVHAAGGCAKGLKLFGEVFIEFLLGVIYGHACISLLSINDIDAFPFIKSKSITLTAGTKGGYSCSYSG